jgi:hypothetical protein
MAKNVSVSENHFTYGGISYFRGHAENIKLGSFGEKKTPLTKMNYLEVKDHIPAEKIGTAEVIEVDVDFTQIKQAGFNLNVSATSQGIPVSAATALHSNKASESELSLLKFSIEANDMMRVVNGLSDQREQLKRWGGKARIAHQVFVVVEATLATKFAAAGKVDLMVGKDSLGAALGGSHSTHSTSVVSLSKGTCFAYLLAKLEWKNDMIHELHNDQWGLG